MPCSLARGNSRYEVGVIMGVGGLQGADKQVAGGFKFISSKQVYFDCNDLQLMRFVVVYLLWEHHKLQRWGERVRAVNLVIISYESDLFPTEHSWDLGRSSLILDRQKQHGQQRCVNSQTATDINLYLLKLMSTQLKNHQAHTFTDNRKRSISSHNKHITKHRQTRHFCISS